MYTSDSVSHVQCLPVCVCKCVRRFRPPPDLLLKEGTGAGVVRMARVLRMMRLLRMLKIVKCVVQCDRVAAVHSSPFAQVARPHRTGPCTCAPVGSRGVVRQCTDQLAPILLFLPQ